MWQGEERARREAKAAVRARAQRVEKLSRQEVAPWPFHRGGRRDTEQRRREAEEQAGGGRKWIGLQFKKFQGPYCKPAITFNLGLK